MAEMSTAELETKFCVLLNQQSKLLHSMAQRLAASTLPGQVGYLNRMDAADALAGIADRFEHIAKDHNWDRNY